MKKESESIKNSMEKISQREKEFKKEDGIKSIEIIRSLKKTIPKKFYNKTFANYESKKNQTAWDDCLKYARNFEENMNQGKGLFLTGPVGSGKTHLAVAIADYIARILKNKVRQNLRSIIFISAVDLLSEIKYSYESNDTEPTIKRYENCGLLILDDLGIEKSTEWTHELFYKIIDTRYKDMKPIIITTNLTDNEIKKKLSERIASRIYEICKGVKLTSKDYRVE